MAMKKTGKKLTRIAAGAASPTPVAATTRKSVVPRL